MWLCLEPRAAQQHTWRAPSQQHELSFLPAAIDTSKGSRESSLSALPRRRAAFPVHLTLLARCPWPHHPSPLQREHQLPKARVTKSTAAQPGHGMRPGKPRGSCFAATCLGSFSAFTLLLAKLVQSYQKHIKGGLIT